MQVGVDPGTGLSFASELISAADIAALATAVRTQALSGLGCADAILLWDLNWPDSWSRASPVPPTAAQAALLAAAAADPESIASESAGTRFRLAQCYVDGAARAVLMCAFEADATAAAACRARAEAFFDLVRPYLLNALERSRLLAAVAHLEQSDRLQRALYEIADLAGSDLDMPEMLRGLHKIVGTLMYAEHLYIALHDPSADTLRFIYFADVFDTDKPDPEQTLPMSRFERGLTWYLIRDGHPLIGSHDELAAQVSGPLHVIGTDSLDFLGVPMVRGNVVYGALVVQSYVERPRYTADDQALLSFVANHILTALERKRARDELERRVVQRTRDLAKTNEVLAAEARRRRRGERLQTALYEIAELANSAGSVDEFYAAVHAAVGALINSRNFYIALLSDDREELVFPYWVDEQSQPPQRRALSNGVTEYVLRRGEPYLVDMTDAEHAAEVERLILAGELTRKGASDTVCWLGAPLVCAEEVVGVVAVQSYSPMVRYTRRDQELLMFVSHQIASSLQRRRATEALQRANAELEQRVAERTRELSEQIAVREQVEEALQQRNSELEALNRRLAGAQSQLLQSEKMASVGQLAAGVAHEINNPIGYVHSNLSSLSRYLTKIFSVLTAYEQLEPTITDTSKLDEIHLLKQRVELDYLRGDIVNLLAESVEGVTRVEKIVRDLKDFSHVDNAEWQIANVHDGIDSTLNVVWHELKYKGEVVKEYGEVPEIRCLPFQLNQVFMNLLVNAAHAIEKQGRITIRTGCEGGQVWIAIADSGKGIDARHLDRIFEPFFTTKPVGIGTGLGLSVSYGIIQKHGGTIDVESEVGKGTTFTIRLPVERAETEQ